MCMSNLLTKSVDKRERERERERERKKRKRQRQRERECVCMCLSRRVSEPDIIKTKD